MCSFTLDEFAVSDLDLFELLVGHFDSGFIFVRVQHCLDFEPRCALGATDQINDRFIIDPMALLSNSD